MRLSVFLSLAGLLNTTLAAALRDSSAFDSGGRKLERAFNDFDYLPSSLDDADSVSSSQDVHGRKLQRAFNDFDHFLGGLKDPTDSSLHAPDQPTNPLPDGGVSLASSLELPTATLSPTVTTIKKDKELASTSTSTSGPTHSPNAADVQPTSHTSQPPANPAPSSSPGTAAGSKAAESSGGGGGGGGTSEWKIIGVAVIAFSTVAAILLLSVFFDHWWRFVRDLVWRRKRSAPGEEELVPDWEKAEWELRFEDRQRYPSFGSLPSIPVVHPGPGPAPQLPLPMPPSPQQVMSPPMAAVGAGSVRRDGQAYGKGPARQLGGFGMRSPSNSTVSRSNSARSNAGHVGASVGLGLNRAGSFNRTGPQTQGAAPPVPRPNRSPQMGQGNMNARGGGNPFDDPHSPMPEDVYGGMAD